MFFEVEQIHISTRRHEFVIAKTAALCFGFVAMLSLILGCGGGMKLLVETEPSGAGISASDGQGKVLGTGVTPAQVPAKFDKGSMTVSATPPAGRSEEFDTTRRQLSQADYNALPQRNGVKVLTLPLTEGIFTYLPYVELAYDRGDRELVAVLTRTRSYYDEAESGGTVPTRLLDLGEFAGIQGITIQPDGKRLVFSVIDLDVDESKTQDRQWRRLVERRLIRVEIAGINLRAMMTTGGGIQQLTDEGFRDRYPAFSADGQFVLFCSNRRRTDGFDILRMPATGRGGIADVYVDRANAHAERPTQAANGTIAYCLQSDPADPTTAQIWTVGGPNQFPTQIARGSQPAISPDGSKIAYVGLDGNLYLIGSDGTTNTQVTRDADTIRANYRKSLSPAELAEYDEAVAAGRRPIQPFSTPSFGPDGRYVVYTGMAGLDPTGRPNEDIYIAPADASRQPMQLTTNGSSDRYPTLAPDNSAIYLLSNRGARWGIWRIPLPREIRNELDLNTQQETLPSPFARPTIDPGQ